MKQLLTFLLTICFATSFCQGWDVQAQGKIKQSDLDKFAAKIKASVLAEVKSKFTSYDASIAKASKTADSAFKTNKVLLDGIKKLNLALAKAQKAVDASFEDLPIIVVGEVPQQLGDTTRIGNVYQLANKPWPGSEAVYNSEGKRLRKDLGDYTLSSTGRLTLKQPGVPVVDYYK